MSEWQPIGTAPKDGRFIIGVWEGFNLHNPVDSDEDFQPSMVWFHNGNWKTMSHGVWDCQEPEYWTPMPALPEVKEDE